MSAARQENTCGRTIYISIMQQRTGISRMYSFLRCSAARDSRIRRHSQVKSKQRLIRHIAREFGISTNGRYVDVYDDLVFYLKTLDTPLIILDEAGDLQYEAFLELKALWNATERCCAWYMMGADGLKEKINRSIECKKVGYTEMLSRYGDKYSKVTPDDAKEREVFLKAQAAMVAKLNAPESTDIVKVVNRTGGSLRRVYTEIEKLRKEA